MKSPSQTISLVEPKTAPRLERRIIVRDLMLAAEIGIHAHERGSRQPIRINLEFTILDGQAIDGSSETDRLSNAVCYQEVVGRVRAIVEGGHINLVETLAERIAQTILEDARVSEVRIMVEKTTALAGAASVGVDITRNRTSYA